MEPAQREESLEGRVLEGRYRILGMLGAGGMGAVYRAEHIKLGREVALKVLLAEYGNDATLRGRFEREAKALAALSHPNVVTVTDYGVADDMPYLVMELLAGRTLKERLAEGPLSPGQALQIEHDILRGLAYAHSQGVAHRDLKPGNVFLQALPDGHEHVKLLDFGLAKFVAREEPAGGPPLTRTGAILGTPSYMAPEQATGDPSDIRSDVYAAGLLLFEMLAGVRPFDGEPGEVLRMQLLSPLPRLEALCPSRVACPELEALLARATAKERPARFQDAGKMLAAISALPDPAVRETGVSHERPKAEPSRATVSGTAATMPGHAVAPTPSRAQGRSGGKRVVAAVLGAAALLVVLGAVAVAGLFAALGPGDAEESERHAAEPAPPAVRPPPVVDPPPPEEEPAGAPQEPAPAAAPNPWDARPTPSLLAQTKRQLDLGRAPSERTVGRLRTHAREHREDPRPLILIARTYFVRGWRPDAIERYELAFEATPQAAGDPAMLADLVQLAAHSRTSTRATALLQRAYGARAVAAIDEALAADGLPREDAERLRRARDLLAL